MDLVSFKYTDLTAIDIAQAGLDRLRANLDRLCGDEANSAATVRFVRADARDVRLEHQVDVWHDRATFHFITDETGQRRYAASAALAVRPGGHLVLATFSDRGPDKCSGLDVARHSIESLQGSFAGAFELIDGFEREHLTPWGSSQWFTHAVMVRTSALH